MTKVILIGPISRDTIIKDKSVYHATGGAVYYQANVFSRLGIDTQAVVTIAKKDQQLLTEFPENVKITPFFVNETLQFENIYSNDNPNSRIQKAYIQKNSIKFGKLLSIDLTATDAIILCPLSPWDIPLETIKYLSRFNIPIYLGAQGYLRHIKNDEIILKPWRNSKEFLKYVEMLFIDEFEAKIIRGENTQDLIKEAKNLASSGPQEVIITLGNKGALIYSQNVDKFYKIPALHPNFIRDPTGLGDTFMAAYIAMRFKESDPEKCGIFASIVSTIKIENKGPFRGNRNLINERMLRTHENNNYSF
jgi:sugar/nucleoside kinase (ribokinase family)